MNENMADLKYAAEVIRQMVPCIEAGHAMGIETDNQGRCACPFHGGTHKNMKLYGGSRGYYCFVCHETGSVIDLVMKYQNVRFPEAVSWLNDAFGLRMDLGEKDIHSRTRRAVRGARGKAHGNDNTRWERRQAAAESHRRTAGDGSQKRD